MLAAGAYPLLPGCFSSKAYVANGKVRLAAIGCGAQAWFDLNKFAGNKDICEVVALCDTDIGAPHTEEALKRFPNLPRFHDFRKMFDKMADKIDAVLIGIPDHSHFCAAMHAMRLGKAVYVEKPLAHSFRECELLMAAEEKYGVVTQMGNQGHSGANFYQYRDYVQNGVIKDVKKVVAHMNMQRRWHKWGGKITSYPRGEVMPDTLDWEVWCNAAPYHDFSKDLAYGEWRCWYDYGNGCMGDWGAHILDCVHRFTLRSALPTEVAISNVTGWNPFVFPKVSTTSRRSPRAFAMPTTRGFSPRRRLTTVLSTRLSNRARRYTSPMERYGRGFPIRPRLCAWARRTRRFLRSRGQGAITGATSFLP